MQVDIPRSIYKAKLNFDELSDIQLAKQKVGLASAGSWEDDPIFDVSVRIGRHALTFPVKAISKIVAERECQKCLGKHSEVTGARRRNG